MLFELFSGETQLLYSSDYPHQDFDRRARSTTWRSSRRRRGGTSSAATRAKLFGLDAREAARARRPTEAFVSETARRRCVRCRAWRRRAPSTCSATRGRRSSRSSTPWAGASSSTSRAYTRASRSGRPRATRASLGGLGVVQLHTAAGVGNAAGMLGNASVGGTPLVAYVGSPRSRRCVRRARARRRPRRRRRARREVGLGAAHGATRSRRSWRARSRSRSRRRSGLSCSSRGTDVMAAPCHAPPVAPSLVARPRPDADAIREAAAARRRGAAGDRRRRRRRRCGRRGERGRGAARRGGLRGRHRGRRRARASRCLSSTRPRPRRCSASTTRCSRSGRRSCASRPPRPSRCSPRERARARRSPIRGSSPRTIAALAILADERTALRELAGANWSARGRPRPDVRRR